MITIRPERPGDVDALFHFMSSKSAKDTLYESIVPLRQ
jgi:hypothetical protein